MSLGASRVVNIRIGTCRSADPSVRSSGSLAAETALILAGMMAVTPRGFGQQCAEFLLPFLSLWQLIEVRLPVADAPGLTVDRGAEGRDLQRLLVKTGRELLERGRR
jgi:hypothetical protein